MKYGTLGLLFALFLFTGCSLDKKINDAATKCETIISEALEGLEGVCLTKEELLELIAQLNLNDLDAANNCEEGAYNVE